MKIEIEVFPIKIVNGEEAPLADNHFSAEDIKEILKYLVTKELDTRSDRRENFEFISFDAPAK
jgi:hypothetical protein